jgi:AhpD family alkylhydroperoxidase
MEPELRAQVEAQESAGLPVLPRVAAYLPEVADLHAQLSAAIAKHGGLPARLRELIRIRVAFHNQCRTCMSMRYAPGLEDGVNEELVCSLERPQEAEDLTDAERVALRFADLFATNHLPIDDALFDQLREYFTEKQIVGLCYLCASTVGFGRMGAVWNVVEALPPGFAGQVPQDGLFTPWGAEDVVIMGARK